MKNRYTKGYNNRLFIAIIVLVILIVVALGIVLWRNTESGKKTTIDTTKDTLRLVNMSDLYGLQFQYPQNWTARSEQTNIPKTSDASSIDRYVLVSPDEKYKLNIEIVSRGQYGSACGPEEVSNSLGYDTSGLDGWPGKSMASYYFEDLEYNEWYAVVLIGLTPELEKINSNSNHCDVAPLVVMPTSGGYDSRSSDTIVITTYITKNTSEGTLPSFATEAQAKVFVESQNFKDIKDILLSVSTP